MPASISWSDLLNLILLGFWIPLLAVYAIYMFSRFVVQRRVNEIDEKRLAQQAELEERRFRLQQELEYQKFRSAERAAEREASIVPEIIERRFEDLRAELVSTIDLKLQQTGGLTRALGPPSTVASLPSDYASLIGELSHALNTPLSWIEAASLNLDSDGADQDEAELQRSLRSITRGVELSKAVLAAYRGLAQAETARGQWSPASLSSSVKDLIEEHARRIGKVVKPEVSLPDSLEGYSNSYTLSLLLPVIENAIEASPDGEIIRVAIESDSAFYRVHVSNRVIGELPTEKMFEDGFTTKQGDRGHGLSVVQRLLSSHNGASISYEVKDERVSIEIELPARQA